MLLLTSNLALLSPRLVHLLWLSTSLKIEVLNELILNTIFPLSSLLHVLSLRLRQVVCSRKLVMLFEALKWCAADSRRICQANFDDEVGCRVSQDQVREAQEPGFRTVTGEEGGVVESCLLFEMSSTARYFLPLILMPPTKPCTALVPRLIVKKR